MPVEIEFLSSPLGGLAVIVFSLLAFGITAWWAFRGADTDHRASADRRAVFAASLGAALVLAAIDVVALLAGWWVGAWSGVPIITTVALTVLAGTGGFALWLALYRALARRVRRPLLAYACVVLLFVPVVLVADPIQVQRGWFEFAGGYTIWTDVALGQIVMWTPVLLYEALRRRGMRAPLRGA
jgi:hypothetical protein